MSPWGGLPNVAHPKSWWWWWWSRHNDENHRQQPTSVTVTVSGATPTTEAQPGASAPTGSATPNGKTKEDPPAKSPYPSVAVDVIDPSRFQLGVGYGRTRLDATEFFQRVDTVDGAPGIRVTGIGNRPYANLPLLTLPYYVLPLRGKVFAGQAYKGYPFSNGGLALTLGLALNAPLERVFFGVSSEPFPGINVSIGTSAAYVEKADTGFFATRTNPSPVIKEWRRGKTPLKAPAWAIAIDPTIAVSAIGKLIGLK